MVAPARYEVYVLRWRDLAGQTREEATEIPATKKNRPRAERLAADKERGLAEFSGDAIRWTTFVERYHAEHLAPLSPSYTSVWWTVTKRVTEVVNPDYLADVDAAAIDRFVADLRRPRNSKKHKPVSVATVTSYVKTLAAGLNWAAHPKRGLLSIAPKYERPKSANRARHMRGRPLVAEEYDRMIEAAAVVRPSDTAVWRRFLDGLWRSGLRIGEAYRLSWDWTDDFAAILDDSREAFRIEAAGQKSRKDEICPMAPDFAEFLRRTPADKRTGRVFRLGVGLDRAGKIISEIGKAARVKTKSKGGTATAHDLRRSFATRWARLLAPAELRTLMRHADITTTMRYYVDIDAADLTRKMRNAVDSGGVSGGKAPMKPQKSVAKDHHKP